MHCPSTFRITMKRIALFLFTMIAFAAAPARAEVEISFDFFHDSLAPYGEWSEVDGYGHVWHPSGVDDDWTPYSDGYWTYTDAGWTWVSYEDFGGICYHYGRWTMVDGYGWCWVPDYEWGPAWVSWRRSDDHVGWAPLPPEARWERRTGFGLAVDVDFDIGPAHFRFCRWRDFGAPVIRSVCEPRTRNLVIIHQTVNITNISYRDDYDCVFNGGFDYDYVAPRVARPVPALKLVRNKTTNIFINGNKGNIFINSPRGNALVVAAPAVARTNHNVLTKKLEGGRKFDKQKVNRGWAGLDKDAERERLLVKMREETRGKDLKTPVARTPKPESLAVLPKKVDFEAKSPALVVAPRKRDDGKKPGAAEKNTPAPIVDTDTRENPKPSIRPEPAGKEKQAAPVAVREPEDAGKPGKPVVNKQEADDPAQPSKKPQPFKRENGTPGQDTAGKGGKKQEGEAAREAAREQAAERQRAAEAKQQAEAARKNLEKQQRAADLAEKEQAQAAAREAARDANARREADGRNREAAERNAAQNRERAAEIQRQRAADAAEKMRSSDSQRNQAEQENRRQAEQAAQERAAAQAQARAVESQRQQAAEAAARQRAAQAEAAPRRQPPVQQPPAAVNPSTGDGTGRGKGKGKDKDKKDD